MNASHSTSRLDTRKKVTLWLICSISFTYREEVCVQVFAFQLPVAYSKLMKCYLLNTLKSLFFLNNI
jgi:hypothetical protein